MLLHPRTCPWDYVITNFFSHEPKVRTSFISTPPLKESVIVTHTYHLGNIFAHSTFFASIVTSPAHLTWGVLPTSIPRGNSWYPVKLSLSRGVKVIEILTSLATYPHLSIVLFTPVTRSTSRIGGCSRTVQDLQHSEFI